MKTPSTSTAPKGEKKRLSQHLEEFLRKNRIILLVILGVLVVAVAGVAVYSIVDGSLANAAALRAEKLTDDYSAWSANQDAAKKAEAGKALKADLSALAKKYPGQFGSARALSLLAKMAADEKDYAAAEENWLAIYKGYSRTYLGPLALQNAATAAEERGANDKAVEHLKLVLSKYSGKTVGIPHVYFSLGRLAEDAKDYPGALGYYEKLTTTYADDDWTKLAKDRIIALKAQGLAK